MDAALLQRYHPQEYHRRFLVDGLRPDGRTPQDRRPAELRSRALECSHGSASLRLGHSSAVAGVRAEVTEVTDEQPILNPVTVTVELPPLCSASFRDRNIAAGVSTFLSSALTDVLNSTHVLDSRQMQIRDKELMWTLHLHVLCLNYDGNAFDLCLLAALAALEDVSLPALSEDRASGRLIEAATTSEGREPIVAKAVRLALRSRPLPMTFAQMPGDIWVVDPSASEESLGASVSLCLVGSRWLVYHQGGGAGVDRFLSELMPLARSCTPALTKLLEGAVRAPSPQELAGRSF